MKAIALVLILSVSAFSQPHPHSNWSRAAVKNQMTDARDMMFSTYTRIDRDRRVSLDILCHGNDSVLIFVTAEYTTIEQPRNNELAVRFDNDDSGILRWSRENDYHTLSSLNPRELLDDYLLDSSIFRVEFTEYPATPHVVAFHVAGLRSAIKGYCGIK